MKIGIASNADIRVFIPFFSARESIEIIEKHNCSNAAPAVNTLILTFLTNGHYVRLFTLSDIDFVIIGNNIDIYGVKAYYSYPTRYLWGDFTNAKRIRAIMQNNIENLDILHAHWTYTYAYAVTKFVDKIPVFCTVIDWAPYIWKIESNKNKITWAFRYVMNELVFRNKGIHFISNSLYTQSLIRAKYSLNTPVIPNSIRSLFITSENHELPSNLEIICVSSSNDKRKNIKNLLIAFKKLLKKYPSAHLSLVGSPFIQGEATIEAWNKDSLLENVSLVGSILHEDLKYYFDRARVFVSPSLEETFGNTLLEAMARKIPIVAGKNSGAVPYVLDYGKAGFLCDVSDVDDLVYTIEYVHLNLEEANYKREWASSLLVKEYKEENILVKHFDLYTSVKKNYI